MRRLRRGESPLASGWLLADVMDWIALGDAGLVALGRVVAVGPVESGGMARLLRALPDNRIIILTGGRKRRSVLVLDTGQVVVTALTVEEIRKGEWRVAGHEAN